MKFLRMIAVNCKKYFKDYKNIVMMFIVPIVCIILANFMIKNSRNGLDANVALINLDRGSLGKELALKLGVSNVYNNREKALKNLKNYDCIALYEIPENFTEDINNNIKPTVYAFKIEDGNSTGVFEANLEDRINELLQSKILLDSKIISNSSEFNRNIINLQYNTKKGLLSSGSFLLILIILFLMVTFSSSFSSDLLMLRKGKILERFLSTNNRGYQIMGSIYLSMLIVQTTMYTLSFVLMDTVFKFKFENFGVLILNIILISAISISLGIMISRIFQDSGVATVVITLISMTMFFLYVGGMNDSPKVPGIIVTFSKFTPFYWAMDSIEKSIVFPNMFILILMALAFFSAGSIKYSSFAKNS